ncbi:MAG: aldo/keto reductase [Myxococcales bacterium]|nr:aldo/keto reductase [Myxococcales bacterium]
MEYRRLGRSGLKVSALSFGAWVTYGNQMDEDLATGCMKAAREAGVNFFDNAEVYNRGNAERIMGQSLKKLGWRRGSYVVSTKFFWGLHDGPNEKNTLNRKYLLEAMDAALERFELSHVDIVYAHRPDDETPVDETVLAFHNLVERGKAHYWGTSEWSAERFKAAWDFADRWHLHRPVVEQPQYNLLHRERVEVEYAPLYAECGMGTTVWSPLASGLLTGKYNGGIPDGSRGALKGYEWLRSSLTDEDKIKVVKRLGMVADGLGVPLAQLAIAWCLTNPNVSTVITGASRVEQVVENMKALDVVKKLTPEVRDRIDAALAG